MSFLSTLTLFLQLVTDIPTKTYFGYSLPNFSKAAFIP